MNIFKRLSSCFKKSNHKNLSNFNNCCKREVKEWDKINIPPIQSIDLKRAIGFFFIILIIISSFCYYIAKIKLFASFIIGVILSFILLNLIFLPHNINTFSEFDSAHAVYIFVQTFTPLIIYIYALYIAINSSRCNKNWI